MKHFKHFLCMMVLYSSTLAVKAQMYEPLTSMPFLGSTNLPSAYAEPTINESNGAAKISIPLCMVANGGYEELVSISYNSTGIRVDEQASRVGLGWSLQAGGSITRVVCGLPDEHPDSGILIPGRAAWLTGTTGQMAALYKGEYDGEFDYYVLQAGSLYAKFFFDGTAYYCMPASGIKIERGNYLGVANAFKVTDTKGIQYFFTLEEKVSFSNNKTSFKFTDRVFAWQLTQVLLPNEQSINYTYKSTLEYWSYGGRSERAAHVKHPTFLDDSNIVGDVYLSNRYSVTDRWNYYKVHPIERIDWKGGQLYFEYNLSGRTDVPGDIYLNSVFVKNSAAQVLKRFVFSYTQVPRLMLQSLQEYSLGAVAKPPYLFTYNPGVLPAVGSFSQDRFGYYNAEVAYGGSETSHTPESFQTALPPVEYWSRKAGTAANQKTDLPGATRNVSPYHLQFMSLTSITFPGGAVRSFEFEPNMYVKTGETTESYGPGMRVKRIIDDDGNGNKVYKKYSYQGGVYHDFKRFMVFESYRHYYMYAWVQDQEYTSTRYQRIIYRMSDPASLMPSLFPATVTYNKVISEETDANGNNLNGLTENEYYTPALDYYVEPGYGNTPAQPTAILLTPHFFFGTLIKTTLKKKTETGYTTVKEISYEYNFNEPAQHQVFAYYPRPISPFTSPPTMYGPYTMPLTYSGTTPIGIHKYYYRSQPFHLTKTIVKEWGTNGSTYRQSQTEYFYEPAASAVHYAPIRVKQTLADGSTYTQFITRAASLQGSGSTHSALMAVEQLKTNNQGITEIESYTIKNEGSPDAILLQASYHEFARKGGASALVWPVKEYTLKQQTLLSAFTPCAVSGGMLSRSASYFLASEAMAYTASGIARSMQSRGEQSAVLLNPKEEFLLASVQHAQSDEIACLGMEWYESNDGKVDPGPPAYENFGNLRIELSSSTMPYSTDAFAGSKALQLNAELWIRCNSSLLFKPAKPYQIFFWHKGGTPQVKYNGNELTGTILQTLNGWNLMQYNFTGGYGSPEIGGTGILDELKIMPRNAIWSSTVYDILSRPITSCDNNNQYTFYEYDTHGRLFRELDMEKNVLKQHTYQWQQTQN